MESQAPVNVKLQEPTIEIAGWEQEAGQWITINRDVNGHPGFFPLTVKGAYVIGVIYTICQSVQVLLDAPDARLITYLPAYGVFASGIELLGRCINGNSSMSGSTKDLETGFKWLASTFFEQYKLEYEKVPLEIVLIQTSKYLYTISNLVSLRHFAAHGQATSKSRNIHGKTYYAFGYLDYEILEQFPPLLADGLENYWARLQSDEEFCNNLAKANVIALRKWPIFLSWTLFEKDRYGSYHAISEVFRKFNWRVS